MRNFRQERSTVSNFGALSRISAFIQSQERRGEGFFDKKCQYCVYCFSLYQEKIRIKNHFFIFVVYLNFVHISTTFVFIEFCLPFNSFRNIMRDDNKEPTINNGLRFPSSAVILFLNLTYSVHRKHGKYDRQKD